MLLIIVCICLLILLIYTEVLTPLQQELDIMEHDLIQAERLMAKHQRLLQRRDSLLLKYESLKNRASQAESYGSTVDLMSGIQALSSGLVDIISMRPAAGESGSSLCAGLELECKGSFQGLVEFLFRINKRRALSLVTLNVTNDREPATVRVHLYIKARG
jgi:hypothetical protein